MGSEREQDLEQMVHYAVIGRCMACGWPLKNEPENGCVQGNCSFRPHESGVEYPGWHRRQKLAYELRCLGAS